MKKAILTIQKTESSARSGFKIPPHIEFCCAESSLESLLCKGYWFRKDPTSSTKLSPELCYVLLENWLKAAKQLFMLSSIMHTRGHDYKLFKPRSKLLNYYVDLNLLLITSLNNRIVCPLQRLPPLYFKEQFGSVLDRIIGHSNNERLKAKYLIVNYIV